MNPPSRPPSVPPPIPMRRAPPAPATPIPTPHPSAAQAKRRAAVPPPPTRYGPKSGAAQPSRAVAPPGGPQAAQRWALATGIVGGIVAGAVAGAALPGILVGVGTAAVTEVGLRAFGARGTLTDVYNWARGGARAPAYAPVALNDVTVEEAKDRGAPALGVPCGSGAKKNFFEGGRGRRWCVSKSPATDDDIDAEVAALRGIAAAARGAIRVTPVEAVERFDGRLAYLRPTIPGIASKGVTKSQFLVALYDLGPAAKAAARAELTALKAFLEHNTIGDLQVVLTPDGQIWVFDPNNFVAGARGAGGIALVDQWLRSLDQRSAAPLGAGKAD